MKKLITTSFLFAFLFVSAVAQNIYIRFNLVPAESTLLTGLQSSTNGVGVPITFDTDGTTPTDAYIMDMPSEGGDIYTKILTLPAGNYQYQSVFADGTGTQGEKGAWTAGRPFTITEEKAVVFRAKIEGGFIKFVNDEQVLLFSFYSDGNLNFSLPQPSLNGDIEFAETSPNYKGSLQGILYPQGSTAFVADVSPTAKGKHTFTGGANGKVRWLFKYNRHTLTVEDVVKVVTLLDSDFIDGGNGFAPADELGGDLGTFSSTDPLLLGGKTRSVSAIIGSDILGGGEKNNNLLKIAPKDIDAKMYYAVYISGGGDPIKEGNTPLTTEADVDVAEYQTEWKSVASLNVSEGLDNSEDYVLDIWYETVCHGDTIKSNVYTSSFTVYNTATGIQQNELSAQLKINGNILTADFEKNTTVTLYSISGQLIDHKIVFGNYSIALNKGVYIFSAEGKVAKVVIQ